VEVRCRPAAMEAYACHQIQNIEVESWGFAGIEESMRPSTNSQVPSVGLVQIQARGRKAVWPAKLYGRRTRLRSASEPAVSFPSLWLALCESCQALAWLIHLVDPNHHRMVVHSCPHLGDQGAFCS
jgi:hypothetical protein